MANKIIDYISGLEVNATPEEIEAVQIYSQILVEDYGYNKSQIQTHPQFRVKKSPSDTRNSYPIDITIFADDKKEIGTEFIVVECKKKDRKDGIQQLKHYLSFSNASIGVWFNGTNTHYLQKIIKNGKFEFSDILNIPHKGQRLLDIGKFKKRDLKIVHNLKAKFFSIRNYLAGNAVGTTRDEELARQIINIILCKIYDEKYTKDDDEVSFRAGIDEDSKTVSKRINDRFNQAKLIYRDVLDPKEEITLDHKSLCYVVGELQSYSFMKAERDVIGDAFEVFIHRALKGGQGQYFTPKNVVKTAIRILDPQLEDRIIDPACGSGGFLIESLKYLHAKIDVLGSKLNWNDNVINEEKIAKANICFCGIEKDSFLSKVVKAYMVLMGDGKSGIFCEDSLEPPQNWHSKTQARIQLGSFDILLANPPFGAKIPVKGEEKLKQFPLGYKWVFNKKVKAWEKDKLKESEAPQILFIDRCLDLVRDGGKLALVLPDGVLSNPSDGYIIQNLLERTEIIGLIDLPMSTFLPYTPTKTHLIFLKKTSTPRKDYSFFMSYVKTCGHDKRGRQIKLDEISLIPHQISSIYSGDRNFSHLGWLMKVSDLQEGILLPKYYNPDITNELKQIENTGDFKIITLEELQKQKVLTVTRGVEVGSENYGTGEVPFVRTSEISNWEITEDCTQCVSEDIYNEFYIKQNIEEEDILVVNDGTYLMGRSAMITKADIHIVIQSHFRKIKILKKDILSPYLLLACLGQEIVQKQIEAKSFRQGTISTLGGRLLEVKIPIPINQEKINSIIRDVQKIMENKYIAKITAQNYSIYKDCENLMGIKNRSKLGNL